MKINKYSGIGIIIILIMIFTSCNNQNTSVKSEGNAQDSAAAKQPKASTGLSIYQLEGNWLTQDNKTITLSNLKGKVQIMAMIFTHCRYACPRIVNDMKDIENELPINRRGKVGFTLVSFDAARDTVGRLKEFANEMSLDSNWTLLHGNDKQIRTLSMLLDVNYEKLANGDFNHTSVINILDENGVIVHRHEGLEMDAKEMGQKVTSFVK